MQSGEHNGTRQETGKWWENTSAVINGTMTYRQASVVHAMLLI